MVNSTPKERYRSIRKTHDYLYMDIELEFFTANRPTDIDEREFKFAILSALKSLHGDIGVSIQVDVLKYRQKDCRAYCRTSAKDKVKFHSALSLFPSWKGQSCCFRIHKMCHSLSSLAIESSNQKHICVD